MDRVLLLASLVVGVIVFFCRFLPAPRGGGGLETGSAVASSSVNPALRWTALVIPVLGLLVTLPSHGAFFSAGQRLGFGFLIGGAASLLANVGVAFAREGDRRVVNLAAALSASYGTSIAAVTLALLFLRSSLLDGLMGVAIGGFCVAFALYLGMPRADRGGAAGRGLVVGTGLLITLATAASLGVFRDPLTPELPKLTWSGILVAFVAIGALVNTGASLLPLASAGRFGRLMPLIGVIGIGSLALYEMAIKITDTLPLALIGIGGLLLWPVALAVLRESIGSRNGATTPILTIPLLAVVVVASGFLAALQTLQGVGAAVLLLGLYVALPATFSLIPGDEAVGESERTPVAASGLVLFSTLLLLWRLFVTRWSDDLKGVNLSDQYALFGLIVGVALPGMLASISARWSGGTVGKSWAGLWAIAVTAALALASPAAVIVLFGAKSIVALLIGLALGSAPAFMGAATDAAPLMPGMLAMAVALSLDQWTGTILPDEAPTHMAKMRLLAGLVAAIIVLVIAANRMGGAGESTGAKEPGTPS